MRMQSLDLNFSEGCNFVFAISAYFFRAVYVHKDLFLKSCKYFRGCNISVLVFRTFFLPDPMLFHLFLFSSLYCTFLFHLLLSSLFSSPNIPFTPLLRFFPPSFLSLYIYPFSLSSPALLFSIFTFP